MDDISVKRGRGRPRGTGKPDGQVLRAIADLLVADVRLRPTTAMKRTVGHQNPSTIRRLQVKWKANGGAFLREAQMRREQQLARAAAPVRIPMAGVFDLRQLLGVVDPARLQAAIDAMMKPSPAEPAAIDEMERLRQAVVAANWPSPAMRAAIDTLKVPKF
jgi:hypothetical protein